MSEQLSTEMEPRRMDPGIYASRVVTAEDREHAELICLLIADELNRNRTDDRSCSFAPLHNCPNCTHRSGRCDHGFIDECIGAALDASPSAVRLARSMHSMVESTFCEAVEWYGEENDYIQKSIEFRKSIGMESAEDRIGNYDSLRWAEGEAHEYLEAAALIREGWILPGWTYVR